MAKFPTPDTSTSFMRGERARDAVRDAVNGIANPARRDSRAGNFFDRILVEDVSPSTSFSLKLGDAVDFTPLWESEVFAIVKECRVIRQVMGKGYAVTLRKSTVAHAEPPFDIYTLDFVSVGKSRADVDAYLARQSTEAA